MALAGGARRLALVSSSKRCHFLAILRGMHDDENDDGHKGYDPWGHLAATAGLPGLVLQLLGLGAGAADKLAIKTLSTEISHSCFF